MNAYPVYIKKEDGTFEASKNIFVCGICNRATFILSDGHHAVARKEDAEKCCSIQKCECGNNLDDPFYSLCQICKDKKWREESVARSKATFDKAKKIILSEVEDDYAFDKNGTFITDIWCYLDDLDTDLMPDEDYIFCAKKDYMPEITVGMFEEWVNETILDEYHDDDGELTIYPDIPEKFIKGLVSFNKYNEDKYQFSRDTSTVIIFTKEEIIEYQARN